MKQHNILKYTLKERQSQREQMKSQTKHCVVFMYVWYLDYATIGKSPERVHDDLIVFLERLGAIIGLEVNGRANVSSPFLMTA